MKNILIAFICLFSLNSYSQSSFDKPLNEVSNEIAEKLNRNDQKRIVVLYITDNDKTQTTAGKHIADEISYNFVNSSLEFIVFDRTHLAEIIEVKRLIDEGYIDAAKAKEIGMILAVDAIIIGNYLVLPSSLRLSLQALDVNSGHIIAASRTYLPLDEYAGELLGINISNNDKGGLINRGLNNIPIRSGENYNNPTTVNNDCNTNNTGDYCFENRTRYQITVILYGGTIIRYGRETLERFSITLEPKQRECFYSLKAIPMKYNVVAKVNHGWTSSTVFRREGNIKVEKCKSKTFVIE